ncbi:LytTR family DNA-binding domain-containing protein [Maribacter sp. 2307UL18-2]|uniref:LytTR family DNA-binding domain-containing protein n=1 Tax=Maribacter sp. 2307UL18-2 TaxID=3386274 RepID=UPI0039BD7D0B
MKWSSSVQICKREYPLDKNFGHHFLLGVGFGLWIFSFLWLSDAFELYQLSSAEKFKRLLAYACVGSLSYTISLSYQYQRTRFKKQWVFLNETVLLLVACTFSSFSVYGIFLFFGNENPVSLYFMNYLTDVYLPSLIIILPYLIGGRLLLGKFNPPKEKNLLKNPMYVIKTSTDNLVIELKPDQLIYLKASGNYVEVHYLDSSHLKKKILRARLADIAAQFPQLYRTHRSYLINTLFFKGFIKQKTNLFVDLSYGIKIPVARNMKTKALKDLPFKTKT